jgi:hypothetical protein
MTAPTGFGLGTLVPQFATRSFAPGSVVSFDFPTPSSIAAGQTTEVLAIHTDATKFTFGTTNLIDGGVASVITPGPASRGSPRSTPEPATFTLFGGCLLGLAEFLATWKQPIRL